jgi:uncharacterized protein
MKSLYPFRYEGKDYVMDGNSFTLYHGKTDNSRTASEPLSIRKSLPFPRTMALTITNNCNLQCGYCYAEQGNWDKPGLHMSQAIAKRAIDLLFSSIRKFNGDFATISFFGGEPLLRFNFIKEIVDYAKKESGNIKLRFAVVTNGTLFGAREIDFLIKKKFILSLSIDGDRDIHDFARQYRGGRGTYDDIIQNIPLLKNKLPILVRATISNHNWDVLRLVKHIHTAIGLERISFEVDHKIDSDHRKLFLRSLEDLFHDYARSIRAGNFFDLRNVTRIVTTFLTKKRVKSHCNAGTGYLCTSADGIVYPCHRFIGRKETAFGNIFDLNETLLSQKTWDFDQLLRSGCRERSKRCAKCPFSLICGGPCFYQAYTQTATMFGSDPQGCEIKRRNFKSVFPFLYEIRGTPLKHLTRYLMMLWQEEKRAQ